MRVGTLVLLAAGLLSCSTAGPAAPPSSNPTPTSPAHTQAADLRTQLDLLLGEHVFIVAKESEAAIGHADEYTSYASLLAVNTHDLSTVVGRAFGNTAAIQFSQAWTAMNASLADYAIGLATHNQDKADSAMANVVNQSVPRLLLLLTSQLQTPAKAVTDGLKIEATALKALIDDALAAASSAGFAVSYGELHGAYGIAVSLGDALASGISREFPDKFPGDPAAPAANLRASLNNLLQERAYLTTMATDAVVNGRSAETGAVLNSLSVNSTSIDSALKNANLRTVWSSEAKAIASYAGNGDQASKQALMQSFASQLASTTGIQTSLVVDQVNATMRVIDDQRARSFAALFTDDRAAATAMQPLADSLAASVQG